MNATCEKSEIWYDASPLVFEGWKNECIQSAPDELKEKITGWLSRYYIPDKPLEQLIRGVTTNPPLSWAAVQNDPDFWREWVLEKKNIDPKLGPHGIWWLLYMNTIKSGAQKYYNLFSESGFQYGFLSGQVDPRTYKDEETMIRQAMEISSLAPNIMIKIPATEKGVRVIRLLTSKGISTNATLGVILPQFMSVARAVIEGLEEARKKGIDLSRWRNVITMMVGRYEELGTFRKEAEDLGIEISEQEMKWASIAILKKAIHLLEDEGYPGKMLLGSMRPGPDVEGQTRLWYFEKLAGANAVFTCGPKFIKAVDLLGQNIEFDENAIDNPVPQSVIEKLNKFRYFREGYEPEGMEQSRFIEHPAVKKSLDAFIKATDEMEEFVEQTLALS